MIDILYLNHLYYSNCVAVFVVFNQSLPGDLGTIIESFLNCFLVFYEADTYGHMDLAVHGSITNQLTSQPFSDNYGIRAN